MALISAVTSLHVVSSPVSCLSQRSRPHAESEVLLQHGQCHRTAVFSSPLPVKHSFLLASLTANEQEAKTFVNLSAPAQLLKG